MKNFVSLIIFTIVFYNSFAQEKFIEYSLGSNAINNTNYSYKVYFTTEEGVYYYNTKAIETDNSPSIKISPLGNEVFMVLDKEIGLYDATYFKMLKESKNPLKDLTVTDIIPDTFGEIFYLITTNGSLYESRVSEKKLAVLKKPLNVFISQGSWNSNLNSLLLADDFYLFYYNPITGEEKKIPVLDINRNVGTSTEEDAVVMPKEVVENVEPNVEAENEALNTETTVASNIANEKKTNSLVVGFINIRLFQV